MKTQQAYYITKPGSRTAHLTLAGKPGDGAFNRLPPICGGRWIEVEPRERMHTDETLCRKCRSMFDAYPAPLTRA